MSVSQMRLKVGMQAYVHDVPGKQIKKIICLFKTVVENVADVDLERIGVCFG